MPEGGPPRVAHIISARGIGGAERLLGALVVAGEHRGLDQLVLNPFSTDSAFPSLQELCRPVPCEGRPCARPIEGPVLRRWMRSRLDAFAPDVVHVVLFPALVVLGTLPRRAGTKRVATNVYGDWVKIAPHGRLIRLADRWAGRRVDHVAAISASVRQFLVSDYGYPASRVTCIPLGWQGTPQPPTGDPRPPTIVCVGGLRPEKGHGTLLGALSLVRKELPDARLVIVGDGDLRPSLEARAAGAGLGESVAFVGSAADVWPHLAGADVFASASRSEAFGIAIAEAMAAGLPVVAPDVGAIPELVRPGVTGELFPAGDEVALAAKLVHLLRSPELRARMSVAAREAADGLRMEHVVERYLDLFEELHARAPGATG